jgi:hypothetical protein
MAGLVRVWQKDDRERQHFAEAPDDEISREWDGTTRCGVQDRLVWVPYERVDVRQQCDACMRGFRTIYPPSEGGHPGPP